MRVRICFVPLFVPSSPPTSQSVQHPKRAAPSFVLFPLVHRLRLPRFVCLYLPQTLNPSSLTVTLPSYCSCQEKAHLFGLSSPYNLTHSEVLRIITGHSPSSLHNVLRSPRLGTLVGLSLTIASLGYSAFCVIELLTERLQHIGRTALSLIDPCLVRPATFLHLTTTARFHPSSTSFILSSDLLLTVNRLPAHLNLALDVDPHLPQVVFRISPRIQTMSRRYSRSALTIVAGICFTALVYLSSPYSPPPPPAFFRSGPGPHRPWGLGFGFGEGGSRGPSLLKRWLWEEDERYQDSVRERQELIEKWGPGEGQVDPCVYGPPCAWSCSTICSTMLICGLVGSPRTASSTPYGITSSRHSSALTGSSGSVCAGMVASGFVAWIVLLSSRIV